MYGDFTPKFVKQFAQVGVTMKQAVEQYMKEVSDGTFPAKEHTFAIRDEVIEKLY